MSDRPEATSPWRDPRLQRALEAAPDGQARPPARLRQAILAQAHDAVNPWWRRWWAPQGAVPWRAAFATLLVGSLVTLIWQGQEIPGARTDAAATTDLPIARSQAPAVKSSAPSAPEPAPAPPRARAPEAMPARPAPQEAPATATARDQAGPARQRVAPVAAPEPPALPAEPTRRAETPAAPAKSLAEALPAPAAAPAQEAPPPTAAMAPPAPAPPAARPAAAAPRAAAPAAAPTPAAVESQSQRTDNATLPMERRAGLRGASSAPAFLATGAGVAALQWTQLRVEAEGRAIVVTRDEAGPLNELVARALQAGAVGVGEAGGNVLRLELGRAGEPLGTLEQSTAGWRWIPAPGPAAGLRLRIEGELAENLRAEAVRLLRR